MSQELQATIEKMADAGRGILAADESLPTIAKRFKSINLEATENSRRAYRELLFATEGLGKYVSAAILFEETLGQNTEHGKPFPQILLNQNIVPGIKVDKGLIHLAHSADEKVTQGLDGLPGRLAEYKKQGAKFAKWRAVFNMDRIRPTSIAITANAECLARYAAICQEEDIVPIVEPELLIDGDHHIETCAEATVEVLHHVFNALHQHRVSLEYIVLKPSMVISGKDSTEQASVNEVAEETVRALLSTVPAAVPSINFLSGGQSAERATAHLNAMNALYPNLPWNLSFSYGRALQEPCLKTWQGVTENVKAAQDALHHRAKLNAAASQGEYSEALE